MDNESDAIFTQAVHAGEEKRKPYSSLTTPIVQTSTYVFDDTAALTEYMERKAASQEPARGEYGRYGNPTQHTVERKLAELEGGEAALLCDSGMGAIASTLLTILSRGKHLILIGDCHPRTCKFCLTFLKRLDVETTIVPIGDYQALEATIRDDTRLIVGEALTGPYLKVLNLPRLVEIARRRRVKVIVDSTLATPCNLKPLHFGVDLVIHHAGEYLAGHNDLQAGVVVGSKPMIAALREAQGVTGGIIDPHNAYLLLRGLKTLAIRVTRQNENGMKVARFLESHPRVNRVYYPGLPSHPDHELARRQMGGFGSAVSFELGGDQEQTRTFIDALRIPYIGTGVGGVESVVEQPVLTSHFGQDRRTEIGLVCYALGIEDAQDLIDDLQQALDT